MPIASLSQDAIDASKAAALLTVQVKADLIATGKLDDEFVAGVTGHIVAALIGAHVR